MIKKMREFINIVKVVWAGRQMEDYLWGTLNKQWEFEEWKRMLAKRVHKIIVIDRSNPHWKIELKKRLIQNACVSIALLSEVPSLGEKKQIALSNLQFYADKVAKCKTKVD